MRYPKKMISKLWCGTWSLGGEKFGPYDTRHALQTIETALEYGIRTFDTAQFYSKGNSDRLLSQVLNTLPRNKYTLSTKAGLQWQGNSVSHNASPEQLSKDLYRTLDQYKIDYVDIFSLHWPDPKVPIEESLEALQELKEKKLTKQIGICNFTKTQLEAQIQNGAQIYHQVHYSPIHTHTKPVLEYGQQTKKTQSILVSIFEQGLLVNPNYINQTLTLGKKDWRNTNPHIKNKESIKATQTLHQEADKQGLSAAAYILKQVLELSETTGVILGARKKEHLELIKELGLT